MIANRSRSKWKKEWVSQIQGLDKSTFVIYRNVACQIRLSFCLCCEPAGCFHQRRLEGAKKQHSMQGRFLVPTQGSEESMQGSGEHTLLLSASAPPQPRHPSPSFNMPDSSVANQEHVNTSVKHSCLFGGPQPKASSAHVPSQGMALEEKACRVRKKIWAKQTICIMNTPSSKSLCFPPLHCSKLKLPMITFGALNYYLDLTVLLPVQ